MKIEKINRRKLLGIGATAVAGMAAAPATIASVCEAAKPTPSQPLGPFFPREQTPKIPIREDKNPETPIYLANDNDLTWVEGAEGIASGQHCLFTGTLTDRGCKPISNATIVIWQASATGLYNHLGDSQNLDFRHPVTGQIIQRSHDNHFQYWGKAITDRNGKYAFKTVVPGFYPANLENGWYRPPHIHMMVTATGFHQHVTQMYFRGEDINDNSFIQILNSQDFLLQNPDMSETEKERLIVDFQTTNVNGENILKGSFDLQL